MSSSTTTRGLLDRLRSAKRCRPVSGSGRLGSLRHALDVIDKEGPWLEFGVHRGRTAQYLLHRLPADGDLHLFDSFEGLPVAWEDRHPAGAFALPDDERPTFEDDRVHVHVGWFRDTVPAWSADHPGAEPALVHIDCDVYESARDVLHGLNDHITPGCVLAFDELWNYAGYERHEFRALTEWMHDFGRHVSVVARTRKRQAVLVVEA